MPGKGVRQGVMLGLLHMTGESLQRLVTFLAPDTFEHVLYPGALRGLADPLGLPRTPRRGRGRAAGARPGAELWPVGEVDQAGHAT